MGMNKTSKLLTILVMTPLNIALVTTATYFLYLLGLRELLGAAVLIWLCILYAGIISYIKFIRESDRLEKEYGTDCESKTWNCEPGYCDCFDEPGIEMEDAEPESFESGKPF